MFEECVVVWFVIGLFMKLDENVYDMVSLLKVYEFGCMDVVVLKFLKFGGIFEFWCVCDFCLYFGVCMCIEDIWGFDIVMVVVFYVVVLMF